MAANARFVFEELTPLFQQRTGIKVTVTYGASGILYSQIISGAPLDLFYSADNEYLERLEKEELTQEGSLRFYAIGRLAVWTQKNSPLDVEGRGIQALLDQRARKIAIANPQVAPYGQAAVAAMQHYGVYDQARDRLVLGENISQTVQFVQSGAADVGLVALSAILAPKLKEQSKYWVVPEAAHEPLEQAVAILKGAKNLGAARRFEEFMKSQEAAAVLRRYGYRIPQVSSR